MAAASSPSPQPAQTAEDEDKVVYIQDGVFVHTAVSIATQSANIIPGRVTIIEKQNGSFVDWSPFVNEEEEFELESSDYSEWDLVTQSKEEGASAHKKKRRSKYAILFNTADLHSIRRSDPKLTWSYAVFILKDGSTLPALHFHSGGISEMIRRLQRYIWLTKSPYNNKLFVVAEEHSALKQSLDQLNLFSEDNPPSAAPWQRFIHSAYYDGMDALSKVTRYVRDVYEGLQQGTEDPQGDAQLCSSPKREAEFEDLGDVSCTNHSLTAVPDKRDLGEIPEVARSKPMQLNEWQSFLDDVGRVIDVKKLHERIFRGGVDDLIRKAVWQYLLGYKKYGKTSQSQQTLFQRKEFYPSNTQHMHGRTWPKFNMLPKKKAKTLEGQQNLNFSAFSNSNEHHRSVSVDYVVALALEAAQASIIAQASASSSSNSSTASNQTKARKFFRGWMNMYSWLAYDEKEDYMYCKFAQNTRRKMECAKRYAARISKTQHLSDVLHSPITNLMALQKPQIPKQFEAIKEKAESQQSKAVMVLLKYHFYYEYRNMKWQWQSMTKTQEKNFSEFRERKHLIDKDVARTDRLHVFYSEANHSNVKKLYDILLTYCMYNFDLGYVQGMSDLLSPILFLMEDEVEAFWCFVGFMERVAHNFDENQEGMKAQLHQLSVLLKFVDPHFYTYLENHDSGNLYFCFRWLLICFKREFSFPDIMTLWETLWSQRLSPNYHLIVCLAILDRHRHVIMENSFGFTDILKYINDLAYNIDVQEVLIKAEQICLQLLAYPDTPEEVKAILTGKNEAMMTPNVEKPDPLLMAHSRHVNLLEGFGLGKGRSPFQTSCSSEVSSQEVDLDKDGSSSDNQTTMNDLDNTPTGSHRADDSNENRVNDSDDEIVVLSEEAQNIF